MVRFTRLALEPCVLRSVLDVPPLNEVAFVVAQSLEGTRCAARLRRSEASAAAADLGQLITRELARYRGALPFACSRAAQLEYGYPRKRAHRSSPRLDSSEGTLRSSMPTPKRTTRNATRRSVEQQPAG